MTTKRPDRWEREVHTLQKKNLGRDFHAGEVVKLLRQQHKAMVRMVKKTCPVPDVSAEYEGGFLDALYCVLFKLNERAK